MNSADVIRLIDERFELVELLSELTNRQFAAINAGHMSALMQLLSQKQEPIHRLHELSRELRLALEASEAAPVWDNEAQRDECRRRHRQSEAQLAEVLKQEAECERLLQSQRQAIGEQLLDVGKSHRAVTCYAQAGATARSGSSLDLSSDK